MDYNSDRKEEVNIDVHKVMDYNSDRKDKVNILPIHTTKNAILKSAVIQFKTL
jgi:hypothetical protein